MGGKPSKPVVYTKLLMLGLKNSGKTEIMYRLKVDKMETSIPHQGPRIERASRGDLLFEIYDIPGENHAIWAEMTKQYLPYSILIWVIDCCDKSGIELSVETLSRIIMNADIYQSGTPILIYLNKNDLSTENDVEDFTRDLIQDIHADIHVQPCSAVNGQGVENGMDWIISKC